MNEPQSEQGPKSSTYVTSPGFRSLTITDIFGRKTVIEQNGNIAFTGSDKEEKFFLAGTREAKIIMGGLHALLTHNGQTVIREIFTERHYNPKPEVTKFTLWPPSTLDA